MTAAVLLVLAVVLSVLLAALAPVADQAERLADALHVLFGEEDIR